MGTLKLAAQHPKTTFGGIVAILGALALLGQQVAALLDGKPLSWEACSAALAALGAGWAGIVAKDADKTQAADGTVTKVIAAAVLFIALGIYAPAFAQEPPVITPSVPALGVCFDAGNNYCLRPIASFGGAAYDFSQHQFVRTVGVNALYELSLIREKLGLAVGFGFETGTVQGATITELVTLPYSLAVGASELIIGSKASISLLAGSVIRF